jgi:hypothetical protein
MSLILDFNQLETFRNQSIFSQPKCLILYPETSLTPTSWDIMRLAGIARKTTKGLGEHWSFLGLLTYDLLMEPAKGHIIKMSTREITVIESLMRDLNKESSNTGIWLKW